MNVLFLDDSVERTKCFKSQVPSAICVSTAVACIESLAAGDFDVVFLDHDLGDEVYCDSSRADTGMAVVRWIVDNQPKIDLIVCHSLNHSARANMCNNLLVAGYEAIERPFAWTNAGEFVV
jgi:hypothetical protein